MNLLIVFTLIGVWEHRKVEELGDTFTGLTGKTKEDFGHGDATFVTYINVFSNPITDLKMTESVEIDAKQNQVEYGDIFFTTSSETPEEVGMSSVWLGNEANVYLNSFCFGYRPVTELAPYYMAFMLRSPNVRKKFMFLAQGISRYNISKNRVMDIEIPVPNIDEQRKVGQFFKDIDDLITLHQRKLDQLKELKKAYLQLMFVPSNTKNNKVPKLRFANFEENWELCKLENIIEKQIKGKAKVENLCNGSVEYLDANRLNGGKPIYTKALPDVSKRDIIILWDGSKAGKVYYGFKGVLGSTLKAYQLKECANSQFIYQQLLDNQNNIYNNYRTPNIPHVVKNFSSVFPIWMTSFEEQSQMADILSNLDNRIILQQNLTDTMISLKKSYLQNMFI